MYEATCKPFLPIAVSLSTVVLNSRNHYENVNIVISPSYTCAWLFLCDIGASLSSPSFVSVSPFQKEKEEKEGWKETLRHSGWIFIGTTVVWIGRNYISCFEKSGAILLVLVGLTAGWQSDEFLVDFEIF